MFLGFSAIALVLLWKEHRNLYLPDGIVFNRGGIGRRISDGAESAASFGS